MNQFAADKFNQPVRDLSLSEVTRIVRSARPPFELEDRLELLLMPHLALRVSRVLESSEDPSLVAFMRKLSSSVGDDVVDENCGYGLSSQRGFQLNDQLNLRLKFGFARALGSALIGCSDEDVKFLGEELLRYVGQS